MTDFIPLLIAYFMGGIPFGIIVTRLAGKGDIRDYGSGNIGATNVARVCGFKTAIWVYIGDIGKAVIALLFAKYYVTEYQTTYFSVDLLLICAAITCVLGNVFPVFLKFKGGKGVNVAMGSVLTLLPLESIISFSLFLLLAFITKYISLASIIGANFPFIVLLIERYYFNMIFSDLYLYLTLLIGVLILVSHRNNIKRLLNGTESKFALAAKDKGTADV